MMRSFILKSGKRVAVNDRDEVVLCFDEEGVPIRPELNKAETRDLYSLVHEGNFEDAFFEVEELTRSPRFNEIREEILSRGYDTDTLKRIDSDPRIFRDVAKDVLEGLEPTEEELAEEAEFKEHRKELRKDLKSGRIESVYDLAAVLDAEMRHKKITGLEGHAADQEVEGDSMPGYKGDDDDDDDDE